MLARIKLYVPYKYTKLFLLLIHTNVVLFIGLLLMLSCSKQAVLYQRPKSYLPSFTATPPCVSAFVDSTHGLLQ